MPPRQHAEAWHAPQVQSFFHDRGLTYLRARKHGAAAIVESGPEGDPVKHLRVRRDTVHLWFLDFADHRGRWERTPFRDQIGELLNLVVDQFPGTVDDILGENPGRTSDP